MPPGRMPQFTSERPNTASSAAMARSQAHTWVKPPPKQYPLIMAMVGTGKVDNRCQRHWLEARLAFRRTFGSASPPRK